MDRRLKALLAIIGGFVLILLIAYVIFFRPAADNNENQQSSQQNQNSDLTPFPQGTADEAARQEEIKKIKIGLNAAKLGIKMSEADLGRMAASFAERFGSYSNQAGFANISDLQVFMTSNMQKWSLDYVEQMKKKQADNMIYYGISTMAVTSEMQEFDDGEGKALALIKTQRRESFNSFENSKTFYQDIIIYFAKENGVWKVDKAVWK